MQWNGVRPNPDRPAPLRSLMEILQQKAEPYVTQYGENQIPGAGQLLNSIMRTGTEMVPGVGDLLGAEDLQTAAQNNDWAGIGLGALAAIPGIPAIGRGVRGEARAARGVGGSGADAMENAGYRVERSQDLAPTDTPESLRAQGYEIDPATNTWARTVATEAPPVDYPIRAYHGSPHSFDRFSLDKIGTGEGAQAYGHGLYFAENENVARWYRDTLSGRLDNPLDRRGVDSAWVAAARDFRDNGYTPTQIEEALGQIYRTAEPEQISAAVRMSDPGSMYEVGINADPNTFLDWDKPLSEQPEPVQRAFGNVVGRDLSVDTGWARLTGEQALGAAGERALYRGAGDRGGGEALLRQEGINGIRFSDASSRYNPAALPDNPISNEARQWLDIAQGDSAEALRQFNASNPIERFAGPERDEVRKVIEAAARRPTSNYVVFNDELVKILRKYGISGLSTTVGASALAEELDRRGQTQEF